jgi:hypothetical protein
MGNHHHIMVELENAEREMRFCNCGEYMTPAADQDGIWLQCRSIDNPNRSRLTRLVDFIAPHDRRLIVDHEALAPIESMAPAIAAAGRAAAAFRAQGKAA